MTRALRSNDVSTVKSIHTTGVNTRLLSPKETYTKTEGAYGATVSGNQMVYGTYSEDNLVSGAIVEDNLEYGIAAFEPNPMSENYSNVLEEKGLKKGDVIARIDYTDSRTGEKFNQILTPSVTFDTAIENIYQKAKTSAGDDKKHIAEFTIYFFRGDEPLTLKANFTVKDKSELTSKQSDSGPCINGCPLIPDGAVFTLYMLRSDTEEIDEDDVNRGNGYGNQGFDNSAGCNYVNTMFYSDRCFYPVAMMPVLDPAGAMALVKFLDPNGDIKLQFPENFSEVSGETGDFEKHTDILQYPSTKKFEEIDDVYLDSCYSGSQAYEASSKTFDSNDFNFPLDPETHHGFPDAAAYVSQLLSIIPFPTPGLNLLIGAFFDNPIISIKQDVYGRFLHNIGNFVIGNFVSKGDGGNENGNWEIVTEVEDEETGKSEKTEQSASGADFKVPPSMGEVWDPLENLTAESIVLNTTPPLTLKSFSDRYGIFDGIDNDGDNLIDINDLADESQIKYGIKNSDIDGVARKLLSKTKSYTIPSAVSPISGKSLTLSVTATPYPENPSVSSVILHNEPTPYTISQQLKSSAAMSLPIDNPRYVAFQSKPVGNQTVGATEKIYYPNLFDIPTYEQLTSELDQVATQISQIPGYEKFGLAGQQAVHDKVLQELMAIISGSGEFDYPTTGDEIIMASSKKVDDAISWIHSNIDEKHKYILKYYLNPHENAFIKDSESGFEAAYLVLDGAENSFDLAFNKDLSEENDPLFSPLNVALGGEYTDSEGLDDIDEEDEDDANFFVPLPKFIGELIRFIQAFGKIPDFSSCCGAAEDMKEDLEKELSGPLVSPEEQSAALDTAKTLDKLEIEISKDTINANAAENIVVTVKGLDEDGDLLGSQSNNELLTINIDQSEENPVVTLASLPTTTLVNGIATFKLMTGGNKGVASIYVENDSGKSSGTVNITAISTDIRLVSFVYFVQEGADELQKRLAEEKAVLAAQAEQAGQGVQELKTGNIDGTKLEDSVNKIPDDDDVDADGDDTLAEDDSTDDSEADDFADGNWIDNINTDEFIDDDVLDNAEASDTDDDIPDDSGDGDISEEQELSDDDNDGASKDSSDDSANKTSRESGDGDESEDEFGNVHEKTFGSEFDTQKLKDVLNSLAKEKDSNITVLVSELVEKTILESTPVEEENPDVPQPDISDWENYYSETEYYSKFIEEIEEPEEWEEEYSVDHYYIKYLPDESDGNSAFIKTRLLASIMTDILPLVITEINPFIDAETNPESLYTIENGDKMVADGKSLMKISAQIYDSNGESDHTSNRKVKFSIAEADVQTNMITFIGNPIVEATDGVATIYIRAGKKTGQNDGHFKIRAEVLGGGFPITDKDLYLVAGDPVSLEITSDSEILPANGQAKIRFYFTVKDKNGNVCKNDFSQISVFAEETYATFDKKADQNSSIVGVQLPTLNGVANLDLYASNKIGNMDITTLLFTPELEQAFIEAEGDFDSINFAEQIGSSKTIKIVDKNKISLKLVLTDNNIKLNSYTNLRSELSYDGEIIDSYDGPIKFKNLSDKIIHFTSQLPQNMTNGYLHEANMRIETSTLSGEGEIFVDIPGFVSDSVKINVLPGKIKKIELSSDVTDYIYTNSDNVLLKATLLDRYGNIVDNDNSTVIKFDVTESTKDFVQFVGAKSAVALKGVASVIVKGGAVSGKVNLFAQDQNGKLTPAILPLKVVDHVTKLDAQNFSPRALYMSVLCGSFGNPIIKDNLAQTFLYDTDSRVEDVTTLTASPTDNKRLLSVDGFGKISLMADDFETNVVPAASKFPYQKITVSDPIANKELATIFLVPKGGTPLELLTNDEEPLNEGIYVKQLPNDDPSLTITKKTDGIYISRDEETNAKIDNFGRISLNNELFAIRLPDEEIDEFGTTEFSFVITDNDTPVALVIYKQDLGDVKTLPYYSSLTSFYPGIYVRLKSPSKKYDFVSSFSGSSTFNAKGIYLVDTENPIDTAQAPGFSQTSLEEAYGSSGVGFDGQNKHMLFFTSGNSVGESNIPYASEVGITYGDPTVRLKLEGITGMVSQFSGFAKTIGKPIFSGDETITNLLDFDFNGDGYDDVLLLYESGLVRLLENEDSNKRFNDRGFVLSIPGGAFSATKIDVNNDGFDDLIAGTKESCKKDEECLSLFTNDNGRFTRQTLNLALDGKAYEMKVGDANVDGCDDLFVSDSAGNIRVFYNTNDEESCTGLETNYGFSKNFGFAIDSTKNTAESLYVYHSAVDQLYQTEVVDKSKQASQIDLSTNEGMQQKIDLEKELQNNKNKYLKLTLPSSGTPGPAKNDDDPNFDPAKNTDPEFSAATYAQEASKFQQAVLSSTEIYEKVVPAQTYPKDFNFINVTKDPKLSISTKFAIDVNGQFANTDDEIQYGVTLKNNSNTGISNLMLSDGTPSSIEIVKDSLKCMDANCPDNLTVDSWIDTGIQLRSHVIKGISVPANGSRKIQYKFKLNAVPKVHFNVGRDLGEYPDHQDDPYLDILVRPEFKANKNAIMTHLYSTGINTQNHVNYNELPVAPATDKTKLTEDQFAKNGFPLSSLMKTVTNVPSEPPPNPGPPTYWGSNTKWKVKWYKKKENQTQLDPELQEGMNRQLQNLVIDSNFNGIPNSWDGVTTNTATSASALEISVNNNGENGGGNGGNSNLTFGALSGAASQALSAFNSMANNIANGIENALAALRCGGAGCLPIPYNYAFLVPNLATPGISAFAWGIPSPIPVAAGWPSQAPSSGRFYISPTLDMGLAIALCVGPGPGHASPCWAFAIPLGALGVCPDFMGAISDAIATAKSAVNSVTGGTVALASDGSGASDSMTDATAFFEPDSPIQAGTKTNIRIPGFPAVITNWLDMQITEIFNKLLDLPDLYFIYPDFSSLGAEFKKQAENFKKMRGGWNSIHDFLKAVNSLPLITIEGKEVVIKVPVIPKLQIDKYKNQTREWLAYEKDQLERLKFYECDKDANAYCEKFKADFSDFIKGVESMLDTLDKIANLPYEILKWKTWESKYATQIICYMDAIMTMVGGYIKKQMKIIQAWMNMVEEIIRIFKSWKMILDLVVDFQVSCDECKNDRFSMLGLLMQLFVVIPSPPIIPILKLPDIVFDISQIQLGMKILWPDVVFKPEPIYLPDLPFITVPVIPALKLEIPGFLFDVKLPQLPELPDLPPLPIPKLPDLPRPPKIPALPDVVVNLLASLKPIFKILCLLKKGFIPVMESQLETEVETLTQPNLDVVLMLLASLAIQLPAITYDYVKEIRITAQIDVSVNVEPIYYIVKAGADVWNEFLKNAVKRINEFTQYPIQEIIDNAIEATVEAAVQAAIEAAQSTIDAAVDSATDAATDSVDNTTQSSTDVAVNTGNLPSTPNELLSYEPALSIKENTEKFTKTIEDFVDSMPKQEEVPEVYYLKAEQTYIDNSNPLLNRTLAQIKEDISKEDLPDTEEMNRLVQFRDALIAYTDNLNKSNQSLSESIDDIENFSKILVENDQSLDKIAELSKPTWFDENANSYLASNTVTDTTDSSYVKIPFFDDETSNDVIEAASDIDDRLLASNVNSQLDAATSDNSAASPTPAPKGIFVVIGDKNENILNYTSELTGNVGMIFMDVDHDDDEDLIYALGGDVYLKENYKNSDEKPHGKVISLYSINDSVSDYLYDGGESIQGVSAPSDNNESADITWLPSNDPSTVAYEITLRGSIYDDFEDSFYRWIVLVNKADTPESIDILDKLDMEPPTEDEENPKVFELTSKEATSISVKVSNGNYYANVFALDENLNKSLESDSVVTAPQDCADKEAPFPAIDPSYSIPVMKEFELDASNSFDVNGRIVGYYVEPLPYVNEGKETTKLPLTIWSDTNVIFDSDGNGIPWDDKNNPKFKIGPFVNEGDVGAHEFVLHVIDQSGNSSTQHFTLEVFVPNITLDDSISKDPKATGVTDPATSKMPFSLMRKRFIYRCMDGILTIIPRLKKVDTPSIYPNQKYYTDDSGAYSIADLETKDIITVENKNGVVIAEINPKTGDIGALKPGYSTKVNEAVPPVTPTSVDIVDKSGNILGSVYVVADANVDIALHQNYGFESSNFSSLSGVHTDDLNSSDEFIMKQFPSDDPYYPGGAALVYKKENKYLAFIDTSGNILITDSRVTLTQKKNNHEVDPLIFELKFNGIAVVEVYIASLISGESGLIIGPNDVPYTTPRAPSNENLYGGAFNLEELGYSNINELESEGIIGPVMTSEDDDTSDDDDDDFENYSADILGMLEELYKRGIINELLSSSNYKLELSSAVTRAEFINILLNMLCIVPRKPEAYTPYQPSEGFSDMRYSEGKLPWFFPYIKEATMPDRMLASGYAGKISLDPETGLPPFKPEKTITRAEAVKIIINALAMQEILDNSEIVKESEKIINDTDNGIETDQMWYDPYITAGTDLTKYLKPNAVVQNGFILTAEEALIPRKEMTLEELLVMALRVVDIYNCFSVDKDNDGISDFYEQKHGINNPIDDPDQDGMTNLE